MRETVTTKRCGAGPGCEHRRAHQGALFLAELWRLKGGALAGSGEVSEPEHWLRQTVEVSRRQEAKFFELRSAANLCRLAGRHIETALREVLRPSHDWFEAGTDAPNLWDASALLGGRG